VQITQAELEVMKALWRKPGVGASEVAEALAGEQDWSTKTIKTLLSRLVEKGALATKQDGRRFLYTPTLSESAYQSKAAGRFIDTVFDGRAAPLVAHLADGRGLTEDDIQELESLIERLKK